MVRKIIGIIAICIQASLVFAQANAEEAFNKGNNAYQQSNYHEAVEHYEKAILESKASNAALHFNLGNAYFKSQQLGKAILHYEKSLKIDPDYEKASYNLEIANARIVDKVDVSPSAAFYSKWRQFLNLIGADNFAILSLVLLLVSAGGFYFFITGKSIASRKAGFALCISLMVFFSLSTYLSYAAMEINSDGKKAIVISKKADVRTEPRIGANTAFVLHEGAKVSITNNMDIWKEIELENGNMGWIPVEDLEEI